MLQSEPQQMFSDDLNAGRPRSPDEVDVLYRLALGWLVKYEKWPDCELSGSASYMLSMKGKISSNEYLSVQAVFLMIACGPGSGWPPISPSDFAKNVMPRMRSSFGEYVNNLIVAEVELGV